MILGLGANNIRNDFETPNNLLRNEKLQDYITEGLLPERLYSSISSMSVHVGDPCDLTRC